jgi:hypothetical protein
MLKRITPILAVAALVLLATAASASARASLQDVRNSTAKFRQLSFATHHGYGLLTDAAGIACIDNPPVGGMGVHWVNGGVGDTVIDPLNPEALVYAPSRHSRTLRLAALEYIVFADAWDATHSKPPSLFGQQFFFTPSPNRFGIPAFYSLHAWVWKHNPAGTLQTWNPKVRC